MKQMKHMKRTELADQRTANRKVFENQDHSRTVEIYLEPVHYQDRGGNWQEMDDTLQETETPQNLQRFREKEIFSGMDMESSVQENKIPGFLNRKGDLEIFLNKKAEPASTVYLSRKDSFLSWGLEGGTYAEARKQEKSVVSYKDIFDGAELRCWIHGEGVKEDLILHKPEAVSDTYSCLYQMKKSSSCTAQQCGFFFRQGGTGSVLRSCALHERRRRRKIRGNPSEPYRNRSRCVQNHIFAGYGMAGI